MSKKLWILTYAIAAVIFFGGYFFRIYETKYFPLFVLFGMAFAAVFMAIWWKSRTVHDNRLP